MPHSCLTPRAKPPIASVNEAFESDAFALGFVEVADTVAPVGFLTESFGEFLDVVAIRISQTTQTRTREGKRVRALEDLNPRHPVLETDVLPLN